MDNTPGALIAMSGGVDSTVAAYLMKQAGYRCMGATMRLYQNEDLGQSGFHTCCSAKDVEDAAEVAFQLDIPFEVVNYTEEFRVRGVRHGESAAAGRYGGWRAVLPLVRRGNAGAALDCAGDDAQGGHCP